MSLSFGQAMVAMEKGEICAYKHLLYKMDRDLRYKSPTDAYAEWKSVDITSFKWYTQKHWKIYQEPQKPETVELTLWGFEDDGIWFEDWIASDGEPPAGRYRKTDQTRTVTFVEGE